jgi:hypothetical protein
MICMHVCQNDVANILRRIPQTNHLADRSLTPITRNLVERDQDVSMPGTLFIIESAQPCINENQPIARFDQEAMRDPLYTQGEGHAVEMLHLQCNPSFRPTNRD